MRKERLLVLFPGEGKFIIVRVSANSDIVPPEDIWPPAQPIEELEPGLYDHVWLPKAAAKGIEGVKKFFWLFDAKDGIWGKRSLRR